MAGSFFWSSGSALDLAMGGIPAFQVKHPVFFVVFFGCFHLPCFLRKKTHTQKKKNLKQTGSVAGFAFGAKLTGKLLKDFWIAGFLKKSVTP